jgi:Lrp/AsnC family leucine-responsive transcriptional regulator
MDAVDRRLVDALRGNARASYAELARHVGLSAPSVHERVGKLESSGVIRGYHASVAPEALGYAISALIGIFLTDTADVNHVEGELTASAAVEDCWFVAGEESFVIKVRVLDVASLEHLIGSLNAITGVARTRTTVVLSTKFEARVPGPSIESDLA